MNIYIYNLGGATILEYLTMTQSLQFNISEIRQLKNNIRAWYSSTSNLYWQYCSSYHRL